MTLFEKALKFDIEYPAQWGNTELNVDDFAVLWPDGLFPAIYRTHGVRLKREQLLAAQNLKEFMPENLVIGKDIQPCPGCKAPWCLQDGCNHMTCPTCGTNYCFICGKEASDNSGHWRDPQDGGSCPRYNSPDAGNAIYDGRETIEDWSPEMSFETWMWNSTMQYGSEQTQYLMQRLLGLAVPTERQGALSARERRQVLASMLQYRPEHGVSREVWVGLVAEHRDEATAFINGGNFFFGGNVDVDPIAHGALAVPIGGVFNLASDAARQAAYDWAHERYNAWLPTTADHPMNFAIFDIGPGTPEDREEAAAVLDILTFSGRHATGGQVEFTVIESPFSQYLLAQVTGAGLALDDRLPGTGHSRRENPLSNLMFEFIRPQNAGEAAQRVVVRQNLGWIGQDAQPEHVQDDDRELEIQRNAQENIRRMMRTLMLAEGEDEPEVRDRPASETSAEEDARIIAELTLPRLRTVEEREREADRLNLRLREMFLGPHEAVQAAQAEDETITGWDFAPARVVEAIPERRRRRAPFAEQELEPWVQPWDELTRVLPPRSQVPQDTPEGEPSADREEEDEL
jgi:hypothetical protein